MLVEEALNKYGYYVFNNNRPTGFPDGIFIATKRTATYLSVVIIADGERVTHKEHIKDVEALCKDRYTYLIGNNVKYCGMIICYGHEKVKKSLLGAGSVMLMSVTGKLYISHKKREDFYGVCDALKEYCTQRHADHEKRNAFIDENDTHTVFATYLLAIITIGLYALYRFKGIQEFGDANILGISAQTVLKDGDYNRLFTYMFAHSGIIHLFYNSIAIATFGKILEERIGAVKFLLVYIYGGIYAGLISCLEKFDNGNLDIISVGASGAIYALAGAVAIYEIYNAIRYQDSSIIRILLTEIVFISSGFFFTNVDNACHIGGYVVGAVFGATLIIVEKLMQYYKYNKACKKLDDRT